MKEPHIPINKGNYVMETPEREALFHKYLSIGWESGYGDYRRNWLEYPRRQHVSEYPLLVDLELSTVCNLKCRMCYTITDHFRNMVKAELMDFELFKKIISEISGKVHAVRLSLRGEPTLHPKFIDCIRFAKAKWVEEVSALTNGSKLTKEYFTDMIDAGIDWVTISVDGMGGTYEKIRMPLKFKDTFKRIKECKAVKNKRNIVKPVIKIQTLWPAIREDPETFYAAFSPYADLIAFNPLIDYLGKDDNSRMAYEEDFLCPQHYQRLIITADGSALACSNDEEGSLVVGDARAETVYDIWHGEKLTKVRNAHKEKNGFMDIPVCRRCYLPRLTEDKEVSRVGERKFKVRNYVNRSQTIGE